MRQMIMCTLCMSNYYLCKYFVKIKGNKKLQESDGSDDEVYILLVKRYAIRTFSGLGM
jgi:hypothetical protein